MGLYPDLAPSSHTAADNKMLIGKKSNGIAKKSNGASGAGQKRATQQLPRNDVGRRANVLLTSQTHTSTHTGRDTACACSCMYVTTKIFAYIALMLTLLHICYDFGAGFKSVEMSALACIVGVPGWLIQFFVVRWSLLLIRPICAVMFLMAMKKAGCKPCYALPFVVFQVSLFLSWLTLACLFIVRVIFFAKIGFLYSGAAAFLTGFMNGDDSYFPAYEDDEQMSIVLALFMIIITSVCAAYNGLLYCVVTKLYLYLEGRDTIVERTRSHYTYVATESIV